MTKQDFFRKISFTNHNGCWVWTGWKLVKRSTLRAGVLKRPEGNITSAHRYMYELYFGGQLTAKDIIFRTCENPLCVSINHLRHGLCKDHYNKQNLTPGLFHGNGSSNPSARLTEQQVREIRDSNIKPLALAVEYGITESHVYRIKNRQAWSHLK